MSQPTIIYLPGVDGAPYAGDAVLGALASTTTPLVLSGGSALSDAHFVQFTFPITKSQGIPASVGFVGESRVADRRPGACRVIAEGRVTFSAAPPAIEPKRAAEANLSVDVMADVVAAWMKAQGIERAHIIGESYGGAVAQTLARRFPGQVSKLALIASFTSHPARATGMVIGPALRWLPKWSLRVPVMAVSRMTVARGLDLEQRRRFYQRTFAMPFDDIGRRIAALRKFDSRPWLAELRMPTMWVWGEAEKLVNFQGESRWLRSARPSDRQIVIAGAGHVIPHVQREVLVAHLRGFLLGS